MGSLTDPVYLTDGRRHLICRPFSIEGLHRMAEDLGISRCWFHGGRRPHYDVPSRRRIEIESRCERVTSREIVAIIAEGFPPRFPPQ
ncbi:DUF4031 domain-containing protein [Aureimonas sp. ME7]|uniref:DUF4031 domain-containing protein n=1 Tax=Aureimonas sp. ME7 TaxID=2744252 RepID=UPI0015F8E3D6|nr:DUF4031 domain-containing protein [Aureimonas sp. ME7]